MWIDDIEKALKLLSEYKWKCCIEKIENNLIYFSTGKIYNIGLNKFVQNDD